MISPLLIGIIRPAIVLPAALLTELSPTQIEMILLHELAHVRRWDNAINLLQRLIESALFFHPAVWWISAWIRQEREHCCDDVVITATQSGDTRDYAALLLNLHQLISPRPMLATAVSDGNLTSRIRRLITRREPMRVSATALLLLAVPAFLTLSLFSHAAPTSTATSQPEKTLRVEKKGGDFASIQSAIDAAPPGATVRIGPGTWEERLTVTQPLRLEGVDPEHTVIRMTLPPEIERKIGDLPRDNHGRSREYLRKVAAIVNAFPLDPLLTVRDTQGVFVRKIKFAASPGKLLEGSPLATIDLVSIEGAKVDMVDCDVLGSPGTGVQVSAAADLSVRHCLIAGMWNSGIVVAGAPAKVRIDESDIRSCYYTGIQIGRGADATVEHCRISATAWHGIRYDDASPRIEGNRIFNVARSGVYASGETHALVTDNLFYNNEMDGISVWFNNRDQIAGNTFAANQREGLAAMGGSKPMLERNLFADQPAAIVLSKISGREELGSGGPALWGNAFSKNTVNVQRSSEKGPTDVPLVPEEHSRMETVSFAGAADDYRLAADSPLRAAAIGVADPLSAESPYAVQPEESAILPSGKSMDYQGWKKD